eukprot:CAMPEP_0119336924 /NCGR_PEP_ID=MMETSP1333-20130426/92932_1 /TAXON_ID=418940 /ORGANISM="Scyphosphaera apsteinii, Strain RCC1455" /LENGTH=296 /DNA_ID=CAMNT_0007347859 /DNA_START=21 /DNA_END=911 /DNA_ORIENTATION=+
MVTFAAVVVSGLLLHHPPASRQLGLLSEPQITLVVASKASIRRCAPLMATASQEPAEDAVGEGAAPADGANKEAPPTMANTAKVEKTQLRERIAELEKELKEARGKLLDAQDGAKDAGENGYMLLAANFERFRLKARDELDGQAGSGKLAAMRPLLPFAERFATLQASAEDSSDEERSIHSFYGGIHKQLSQLLEAQKVEAFEVVPGERYNWLQHTKTSEVHSDEVAEGFIIEVQGSGYLMDGQLLQGAPCIVSLGPEKARETDQADGAEIADAAACVDVDAADEVDAAGDGSSAT